MHHSVAPVGLLHLKYDGDTEKHDEDYPADRDTDIVSNS